MATHPTEQTISHREHRSAAAEARTERKLFPPTFPMVRLVDPIVERFGFDVTDPYVEYAWLPVLGPTGTWMLRRLNSWLHDATTRVVVDLSELGRLLGVGAGIERTSPAQRTLTRLVWFGLAEWTGDVLRVRTSVPPLTNRQAVRLTERARRVHTAIIAARDMAG